MPSAGPTPPKCGTRRFGGAEASSIGHCVLRLPKSGSGPGRVQDFERRCRIVQYASSRGVDTDRISPRPMSTPDRKDPDRRTGDLTRSLIASRCARASLGLVLCGPTQSSLAVDAVFAMAGGDRHIAVFGVGVGWAPWWSMPLESDRVLSLRGTGSLSYWVAPDNHDHHSVFAVGVYPVLRLDLQPKGGVVPYIEGAIGFNVLSHTWIEERRLSTAFQFGEFVGVGISFGDKRQFDLGARYQHISNADIKRPNDGLTYPSIVFQYRFDAP